MYCLYAFNGELLCFVHVLLNALDMADKGTEVVVVFEGMSVKLVPELEKESNPFHALYKQARDRGLIDGACKACSSKLGVLAEVEASGIPLLDGMSGHPPMSGYMVRGYTVLTF